MGKNVGRSERTRTSAACLVAALTLAFSGPGRPSAQEEKPVPREEALAVLNAACSACHGGKKQKAGVDFSRFTDDVSVLRGRKLWRKALGQVASGVMPPEDETPLRPDQKRV